MPLPYRRCAGVALVNRQGLVFIGRRIKERSGFSSPGRDWQMPQGGIDDGEGPQEAAWRELHEETNVQSATLIAEAPNWLTYDLPEDLNGRWRGKYRGQTQKWFLFRFEGPESEINIEFPMGGEHEAEFREWRWETFEKLPDVVVPFKRDVYVKVVRHFAPLARAIKNGAL